jgi:dual specificity MAP kinase phosphatase
VYQLLPHLQLGTQRESLNEAQLIASGITHLLCVTNSFPPPEDPNLKFLHVPISNYGDSELRGAFRRCIDFIESSRLDNGNTLLFCQFAQNRSPTIAIAYLIAIERKSLLDAYSFVKKIKSDIYPHESYLKQLSELERELFGSDEL